MISTESPSPIFPPRITRAKTPSFGMMQAPTVLKMAQPLWQVFPI
jgi:hypothetical protein